jgi:hypothetical protein
MESHHDDDETKGSVYFFVQDYIEAREASGSVRTAGPKDLTVTDTRLTQTANPQQQSSFKFRISTYFQCRISISHGKAFKQLSKFRGPTVTTVVLSSATVSRA